MKQFKIGWLVFHVTVLFVACFAPTPSSAQTTQGIHVLHFEGDGNKQSDPFEVSPGGGHWYISYNCHNMQIGDQTAPGNFAVYLKKPDDVNFGTLLINTTGEKSDSTNVYTFGTFYLDVEGDEPFSIDVYCSKAASAADTAQPSVSALPITTHSFLNEGINAFLKRAYPGCRITPANMRSDSFTSSFTVTKPDGKQGIVDCTRCDNPTGDIQKSTTYYPINSKNPAYYVLYEMTIDMAHIDNGEFFEDRELIDSALNSAIPKFRADVEASPLKRYVSSVVQKQGGASPVMSVVVIVTTSYTQLSHRERRRIALDLWKSWRRVYTGPGVNAIIEAFDARGKLAACEDPSGSGAILVAGDDIEF